jgi:hypothetical protein
MFTRIFIKGAGEGDGPHLYVDFSFNNTTQQLVESQQDVITREKRRLCI